MGRTYRPRHLVLKEFVKLLYEHDPMGLNNDTNPGVENEYDSEALSILARFNESTLQCCPCLDDALETATSIVEQAFAFWFNEGIQDPWVTKDLAVVLLRAYDSSYPGDTKRSEQRSSGEVVSVL